ncbi:hypothetical protein Micr_00003 [Candidatus Micrarchaeum sp.]|nr:hypothetical protein Micr_00003 [Candidatus Micrarchaeum sp.]
MQFDSNTLKLFDVQGVRFELTKALGHRILSPARFSVALPFARPDSATPARYVLVTRTSKVLQRP